MKLTVNDLQGVGSHASVSQIVSFFYAIFQKKTRFAVHPRTNKEFEKNVQKSNTDIFFYLFTVKSYGRCSIDILIKLQSVQHGGFAGRIQAQNGTMVSIQPGYAIC